MDTYVFHQWTQEAITGLIQHYSFIHAWSNWVLEAMLLVFFLFSLKDDLKHKGSLSSMSLGFVSLLGINLAAAGSHGIEQSEAYQLLAKDIAYVNFTLLGFASLFFEFFVLQRVRLLQSHGVAEFANFPFKTVTFFVLMFFILFQLFNWVSRDEPLFLYAILDYGASLVMMAVISLYILFKSSPGLDNKFENYILGGIVLFVLATVCQQLAFFQTLLPRTPNAIFHYNDLYHLMLLGGFLLLLQAKLCERILGENTSDDLELTLNPA